MSDTNIKSAEGILKPSFIIFTATMVGNVSNYLFQFFMGRYLSTEDFGLMNALLSLTVIVAVPTKAVLMIMAKYTAEFKAKGEYGKIKVFLKNSFKKITFSVFLGFVLFALISDYIRDFLHSPSIAPILIVGLILTISFILPINLGVLQGLQDAKYFGISLGLTGVFRLIFGILLVYWGFKVNGALMAGVLSGLAVLFVTFHPLKKIIYSQEKEDKTKHTKEILKYGFPVMTAAFCIMALVNIDQLLVRHFFSAQEAGYYSSASILGRTIFYFPLAITLAMFPMVVELHTLNQDSFDILRKGLLLTAALSSIGAVIFWIAPDMLITLLFGQKFLPAAPLLKIFGLAIFPFTLVNLLTDFNLARHYSRFIYTLAVGVILLISLVVFYHSKLEHVLYIMLSVGILLLAVNLILLFFDNKK